jgi:hypothetical protein
MTDREQQAMALKHSLATLLAASILAFGAVAAVDRLPGRYELIGVTAKGVAVFDTKTGEVERRAAMGTVSTTLPPPLNTEQE